MATQRRNYFQKHGIADDAHRNASVKEYYKVIKAATTPAHLKAALEAYEESGDEAHVLYYVPMFLIAVKELRSRPNLKVVLEFLNRVANWGDGNGRKELNALYSHVLKTDWPQTKPEVLRQIVEKLEGKGDRALSSSRSRSRSRSRRPSRAAVARPRSRTPSKTAALRTRTSSRSRSQGRSVHADASIGCEKQTLKKYTDRSGPPYPANASKCRGTKKLGNDGGCWKSIGNVNGVYTWRVTKEHC
jgi:hypothetical protein